MVEVLEHDGVTQWRFTSLGSRLAGFSASTFLTADGVLIDTGPPAARRDFDRLLSTARITGVAVTHHHEDHAGNVELVASRGMPLWLAPATATRVRRVAPIGAYRKVTWSTMSPLTSRVTPLDLSPLQAIATPGHAADHHVLWDAATRTLFSGDLFLGVAVRIAHHDEDLWASIDSLERAAALEPARMFCAHRGPVPDAASALRAKAAWMREMIETVRAAISAGKSDDAIVRTIMGGESLTGWASAGEYSRRSFVRLVRARDRGV